MEQIDLSWFLADESGATVLEMVTLTAAIVLVVAAGASLYETAVLAGIGIIGDAL